MQLHYAGRLETAMKRRLIDAKHHHNILLSSQPRLSELQINQDWVNYKSTKIEWPTNQPRLSELQFLIEDSHLVKCFQMLIFQA